MIYYDGALFFVPSFLGFVAFYLALNVCVRIHNLELPRVWRWAAYVWALMTLVQSVVDLNQTYCYSSSRAAEWAVVSRSGIRCCHIGIIIVVYRGLGQAFPRRMIRSAYEPNPSCRISQ